MLTINQIDHVALAVTDPARSAEWYRTVLGLERRHQEVWGDIPIMMCAGSTCLALFPAKGQIQQPACQPPVSMRHLAFRATRANFQAAQKELARLGIGFQLEDHQIAHSIYFHDPDGYQLEITTYDPGSAT